MTTMTTTTTNPNPQTPPTTPPRPSHDTTPPIIPPLDLASLPSSPSPSILSPPLSPLSPTYPKPTTTPTTTALHVLTQTLASHPPLPALHHAAYTALGPVRFQRNLARLLSRYARDLRASAVTDGQRRTAREVARSAQGIALGVAGSLGRDGGSTGFSPGFSPRGKRAMVLATLRRGDDVAIPCEDDDVRNWDGEEQGKGECEGDIDTSHLLSSPAFPSLCSAYLAWLNTTTVPPRRVPTSPETPETRRARLTQALADTTTDADRLPSASEYDTYGIWRGAGSRPATPIPTSTTSSPSSSSRTGHRQLLPRQQRHRQQQNWWKSQWTVALVALFIGELLSLAACWAISTRTGVPLRRVVSAVGEWLGTGLAGVVVVHVARHHQRFMVQDEDGEGDKGVCAE